MYHASYHYVHVEQQFATAFRLNKSIVPEENRNIQVSNLFNFTFNVEFSVVNRASFETMLNSQVSRCWPRCNDGAALRQV